jgi:hypothetical protein
MEQSWLPTSTVVANTTHLPNKRDAQIRRTLTEDGTLQKVITSPTRIKKRDSV